MSEKPSGFSTALILQAAVILGTAFLPFYLATLINPPKFLRVFEELGLDLPYPIIFYFTMMLHGKAMIAVAGLLLLAFLFLAEFKCPQSFRRVAKRGVITLTMILLAIQVIPHFQVIYALKTISKVLNEEGKEQTAKPEAVQSLFQAVSKSVQASLLKSFAKVPGTKDSYYFIYEGPGSPSSKASDYKSQCDSPSCILLPSGPKSTSSNDELVFIYPRDPSLSFAPDKVDKSLYESLNFDIRRDYKSSEVDIGGRFPWIRQVFVPKDNNETGLSYALQFRRARLDLNGKELSAKTAFSNKLYEVQIRVFKDFNPKLNLETSPYIPSSNIQINSFVMIVRTP
ncbi:MAG: hypothetical protein P1V97_27070 [Planctomycetota bacterium]|nr:hypothetical protein [Planctomycetota bacterium]